MSVTEISMPHGPESAADLRLVRNPRMLALNIRLERVRAELVQLLHQTPTTPRPRLSAAKPAP